MGASLETRLSVRAASDAGDERLSYSWSVDPSAPGPVAFSLNSSNAARETTARFRNPGNYLLRVTGVATLEKKMLREKPGYADYAARTSRFLPLPPRR